jgi:hypothetical protein
MRRLSVNAAAGRRFWIPCSPACVQPAREGSLRPRSPAYATLDTTTDNLPAIPRHMLPTAGWPRCNEPAAWTAYMKKNPTLMQNS